MTESEATALMEKETPDPTAILPVEPLAPAPEAEPVTIETTLRRLEEQSAFQTELAKRRLFWVRLGSVFLGATMAAVVLAVLILVPRAQATLDAVDVVMENLTQLSQQLQGADIPAILENLDQTLSQGRSSLTDISEAVRSISSIDFEGLNRAIQDLQRMVKNPIGSLFGLGG